MQIQHVTSAPLDTNTDFLVLCVAGSPEKDSLFRAADKGIGGYLSTLAQEQSFLGKAKQSLVVPTRGEGNAAWVAILGCGDKRSFKAPHLQHVAARAYKLACKYGATNVCFALPGFVRDVGQAAQFAAQGAALGAYRFDKYRKNKSDQKRSVDTFATSVTKGTAARSRAARSGISRGEIIAEAISKARNFINEPAAVLTPSQLAKEAQAIARQHKLRIKVYTAKECAAMGMNMFLAVGQGSAEESKLIHLTYKPKRKAKQRIALIGKGVTFDSGGYSIKPSASMEDMKIDMSGAAAVIASMSAVAALKVPYEVHAVAACCENLVSGNAYKLGDVLTAMDGTTVEINNTDAEGRLTLGDAMLFTKDKIKPDQMFDFATLTGACMVALGPYTAGVMSEDESMAKQFLAAATRAGEDMWRLPLNTKLQEQLRSPIADMKNTGKRYGGAITAGLFLRHFAQGVPWVHVDIAGPASSSKQSGAVAEGGTGFAVATIVEYLSR